MDYQTSSTAAAPPSECSSVSATSGISWYDDLHQLQSSQTVPPPSRPIPYPIGTGGSGGGLLPHELVEQKPPPAHYYYTPQVDVWSGIPQFSCGFQGAPTAAAATSAIQPQHLQGRHLIYGLNLLTRSLLCARLLYLCGLVLVWRSFQISGSHSFFRSIMVSFVLSPNSPYTFARFFLSLL